MVHSRHALAGTLLATSFPPSIVLELLRAGMLTKENMSILTCELQILRALTPSPRRVGAKHMQQFTSFWCCPRHRTVGADVRAD